MRRTVAKLDPLLKELDEELRKVARPGRAAGEKAYLKSDLDFYGVMVPDYRRIAAEYAKARPDLDRKDLRAVSVAAFKTNLFDLRSVAVALLDRRRALLEERDLPWLLDLVDASKTWAHVDWIAVTVIGDVVGAIRPPCDGSRSGKAANFWIRRTAILAQLPQLSAGRGLAAVHGHRRGGCSREVVLHPQVDQAGWLLEVSRSIRSPSTIHPERQGRDERPHPARGREVLVRRAAKDARAEGARDRLGKRYGVGL